MSATPPVIRKTKVEWIPPKINSLYQATFQTIRQAARETPGFFKALTDKNMRYQLKTNLLPELLFHIGHGNQEEAQGILVDFPELLVAPGYMKDIAGNEFENITVLEYLLWTPESQFHMKKMALDCLKNSENGEEIRQKFLPILEAYEKNGGIEYCFQGQKYREKYFNFQPLFDAYQTYLTSYNCWRQEGTIELHEAELNELWLKIGKEQDRFPACVRNEFCRTDRSFDPTPQFTDEHLPRTLEFYNCRTSAYQLWGSDCNVGDHFSIWRSGDGGACRRDSSGAFAGPRFARIDFPAVAALCKVRVEVDLPAFIASLRQPLQNQIEPLASP